MVGEKGLNPQADTEFKAKAEEIRKEFDQKRVEATVAGTELDEQALQDEENKALEALQSKMADWESVNKNLEDISENAA